MNPFAFACITPHGTRIDGQFSITECESSAGPLSCLPLDWGAIVPLAFMPEVPIVVITPSRDISLKDHIRFGEIIRDVVSISNKRVGLIASCDWSHAHDTNGPYGSDPAAKALDEEVVQLIKDNKLEKMMDLTFKNYNSLT